VQASLDRTVTTQYDRLNRAIQVTQPSVHNFLPNVGSVAGGTTVTAGASTLYEYNAFGDVILQRQLVGTASYADTYFYYDVGPEDGDRRSARLSTTRRRWLAPAAWQIEYSS
jgi:hypothetical protein